MVWGNESEVRAVGGLDFLELLGGRREEVLRVDGDRPGAAVPPRTDRGRHLHRRLRARPQLEPRPHSFFQVSEQASKSANIVENAFKC